MAYSLVHNNECFSYKDVVRPTHVEHFFQQREDHVLHLIEGTLLNTLDRDYIRETPDLQSISLELFTEKMRATIFALELNEFWQP